MIVTIDGPAGAGKSSVARALAQREGFTYLDTGAMYRAVAKAALDRGIDPTDAKACAEIARACTIEFVPEGDTQRVLIDGVDVTDAIRTPEIDLAVTPVSATPAVREAMVERQRALGAAGNIVCEGRDMGTVVFPEAEVKVYLTADAEARAHRRAVQREGGDASTDNAVAVNADEEAKILADIERRDKADSTRETAPLKAAADAHHIDSSNLSIEQELDMISAWVAEAKDAAAQRDSSSQHITDKKVTKNSKKKQVKAGPMPVFGNSVDDYHQHAMREYPLPARALLGVTVGIVGLVTKLVWPWKVDNIDDLVAQTVDKGIVVVMNHTSMLDPVIVIIAMYVRGRRLRPIYKSEFDEIPFGPQLFSWAGGIPVKRGTADLAAVRLAQHALERGESILIYPEGTRIKSDNQPIEIHGGFALIAQMAKADIVPIAIVGARNISTDWRIGLKPGRVFCKVGKAISFSQITTTKRKERIAQMEKLAMERVYELRDELRALHPGKM